MDCTHRQIEQLILTAETGDKKAARCVLNQGLDVNARDISGISALHRAVAMDKEDFVRFLLSKGASVDVQNDSQSTPLHYAVMMSNCKLAVLLASHSKNVNIRDNRGMTALHHACEQRLCHVAIELLRKGANPNETDNFGKTPIAHLVQKFASTPEVENLLNLLLKETVNKTTNEMPLNNKLFGNISLDAQGMTLLHYACKYKKTQLALSLLENGADVDVVDSSGKTPLHCLALDYRGRKSAETKKSVNDMFPLLLKHSKTVNLKDYDGLTALHYACKFKMIELCYALLEKGANAKEMDSVGRTALHHLAFDSARPVSYDENTFRKLLYQFLNQVFDPKFNEKSLGPYEDLTIALLRAGLDPNHQDVVGRTPLHVLAASRPWDASSHLMIFRPLIQFGGDVDAQDRDGNTPLHYALLPMCSPLLKALLVLGASLTITNLKGETPMGTLSRLKFKENSSECVALICCHQYINKLEIARLPMFGPMNAVKCVVIDGRYFTLEYSTEEALAEMETIRSTKVCGGFSLGEIFSSYSYPYYLQSRKLSEAFQKALDSPTLGKEFPIYSHYLRSIFNLSKARLEVLPQAYKLLNGVFVKTCQHVLPELAVRSIVLYLSNRDLRNLVRSGEEVLSKPSQQLCNSPTRSVRGKVPFDGKSDKSVTKCAPKRRRKTLNQLSKRRMKC